MVQLPDFAPLKHSGTDLKIPKLIRKAIIFAWSKCITIENTCSHVYYLFIIKSYMLKCMRLSEISPGCLSEWELVHGQTEVLCYFPMITEMLILKIVDLSSLMQTPTVPFLTIDAGDGFCFIESVLWSAYCVITKRRF